MDLSRRKTLALLGGGAIVAATAAIGYDVTRLPQDAMRPWSLAGQYPDPRMRALSWAILAPNPHNLQPWLIDLSTPNTATLFVDTTRLLPQTDPFGRQIVIGLGCFLEVLRMAALADGLAVTFELFPQGSDPDALDARPVAVCRFAPTNAAPDPLFAFVPQRRSLKEPYDTARTVSGSVIAQLAQATRHFDMGSSTDPATVQTLRDLSTQAMQIEFSTERTLRESVDLFRIGHKEVNANPDGLEFTGPMFETMRMTGLFTREASMDFDGLIAQFADASFVANMQSAMGHIWLVSQNNTREDQLRAGFDWVRINLAATEMGLGMQPLSQALQEYPEMSALYDDIHGRLAPDGGTVQMWARVGYGPDIMPTPRWPLEEKLVG